MAIAIGNMPGEVLRAGEGTPGMDDTALAWRVEEACLNAWPALREVLFGGWVLRFSGGLTRRANSVNPLGIARPCSSGLIGDCEALYRRQRQPTIFRLPSLIGSRIDDQLAARGYSSEGFSCVLYADLAAMPVASDPAVRLFSRPTAAWLAVMAGLQRHSKAQAVLYRRIVDGLAIPAAFAALDQDGGIAALAFGAIHDRLICFESVVTDARRLRRGYASRVIGRLAAWACEHGAAGACLEVEATNSPALALYDRLGFTELYRYHYRRESPATHAR
jgi:N-acetylglutamate synthase